MSSTCDESTASVAISPAAAAAAGEGWEAVKIAANRVVSPDLSEVRGLPIEVKFALAQVTPTAIARLKSVLANHPGHAPVHLAVHANGGSDESRLYQLGDDWRVDRSGGIFGEIKAAFGPDCIQDTANREFKGEEPPQRRWNN